MVRATKVSQRAEASLVAPLDKEPHRTRAEPHVAPKSAAKRKHSRKSDKEEVVKEKDIVEDEQPVPKRQRKSKSAAVAPKDETMEVQETPVAAASPPEKKAKGQSRKRARDAEKDEGEEIAGVAAAEQTPPTKRARHRRKEPAGKEAESLLRDGEPVAPVLDVAAGEGDPIPADTLKESGGDATNESAAQSAAHEAEERLARGEPVAPVLDVAPGEASTLPMDVATSVPADASVGPHAPPEESKEARVAALEKSMDAVEHQMHQLSEELGPHFHDEKSHPTGRPLKPSSAKRARSKKGGAAASLAAGITEDALSQDTLNTDISMASVEAQPSHSLPPEPIITPIEPSEDANPPAPLPEVPTAEKAVAETPRPAEQEKEKETERTVTPPTEPYTPAPPPFPRDETSPFTATAATPAVETRAAEVPGAQQTEPEPELATEATPMALVSDREEVSNQEASTTTNATTSTTTTAATVPVVGPTMSRTSSGPMEPIELTPTTAPLTADTTTMAGVAGGIEYPLAPQVAAADGSLVAAPEETSAVGKWPTIETENSLKEPTYLPNDHASTAGTAPPRDVHQAPPPPAEVPATAQQESVPTPMDTSTPATEPLIGHDLSAVPPPVTEHVPIGSAAGAPQSEGKDVAQYLEPHVHTGSEFLDWKMEHPEKFLGRSSMAQVDIDEKGETI